MKTHLEMYKEVYKNFINQPWLEDNTILLTVHGSHAYGLNTEASDVDIKGVGVAPREYYLGFSNVWEQSEHRGKPDLVIYELKKFMRLAADCNPNICEILWTDEIDYIKVNSLGEMLINNKELFLSKKARYTFSGYAVAQLKRIKTHYRWLKNPPKSPPTRKELGLPENTLIPKDQLLAAEAAIQKKVDSWAFDFSGIDDALRINILSQINTYLTELKVNSEDLYPIAAKSLGYDSNFLELLHQERVYKQKLNGWNQYQNWKATRNPARAKLEEKFGYDTKHAMHLVRLMRMCEEILTQNKVIVKRHDREELLAIRNGAWSYEKLLEFSEEKDKSLDSLYKNSTLKKEPDRAKLDELCMDILWTNVMSGV